MRLIMKDLLNDITQNRLQTKSEQPSEAYKYKNAFN